MLFLIIAGVVAMAAGLLLVLNPKAIKDMNEQISKEFNNLAFSIDKKVYNLRIGIGISFILAAALFFFVAYFLFKKYG